MRGVSDALRRHWHDEQGAISILAAFVLVAVVGVSALALEYGHALLQKVENQRAADLASYGGALVYNSTGSTDSATSAANNIAALNGLSSGVTPTYVLSPSGDGNHAIKVTATTNQPLELARVLTPNTTLPVSATAYAEINSSAPGCIIALNNGGTGIVANGGTHITANNCAVASNNAVTLSGGAALVTKTVDYRTTHSATGGASISPPTGTASVTYDQTTTSDPLSGNAAVTTAAAHIGLNASGTCAGTSGTVCAITSPSAPSVTIPSGSAVSFTKTSVTGLPSGCSDVYNSSSKVYTVTCTGAGPFNFGTISLSSVTVVLQTSSGGTYNFANGLPSGVTLSGSGGTYGFGAGLTTSGTTSYPAGNYNIVGSITTGVVR